MVVPRKWFWSLDLKLKRDSFHQKDFKLSLPSHRNLLQSECNEQRETEILRAGGQNKFWHLFSFLAS